MASRREQTGSELDAQPAGLRRWHSVWRRAWIQAGEDAGFAGPLQDRQNAVARESIYAGIAAFIAALLFSHFRSTPYNNYVLLAQAFLQGHAWITWPGAYIDALAYNGQHYIIEAPMPAILLLPYVAIAGTGANQTLLAIVLVAVGMGATWELGRRLGASPGTNVWICVFAFAGTSLAWCAMLGDVWFIAHVSAYCFTMLALVELRGKQRGWLVALYAVCAAESRFTMVLALAVYAALLLRAPNARRNLTGGVGVVAIAAALWCWYNLARWGTLTDIGYTTWYHQDQAGMPTGSPFRLMYLPYELNSFFWQYPAFSNAFPWVRPSYSGIALTWTSPALIYALWARRPIVLVAAMWAAAILTAVPNFVYYVNGFAQYGMRHALDFIPFLVALMFVAARDRLPLWVKPLIVYSVVANLYGIWFWNAYVRPGN